MKFTIYILITIVFLSKVTGQEQITSFQFSDVDKGSFPKDFITFKGKVFFLAATVSEGNEIWSTDGTENGTSILKDIYPGQQSGVLNSINKSSVILNDQLYFVAKDGTSAGELWKTDGTVAGTTKVTNSLNYSPAQLTLVGDTIFFLIRIDNELQVWKSNSKGTKKVIGGISIWNNPSYQGQVNGVFIFTFQPLGSNQSTVWRSDGTAAGTYPMLQNIDGNGSGPNGSSSLTQYVSYNSKLYFITRQYLYETDGTAANPVTTLYDASVELIDYSDVIVYNNLMYFSFFDVTQKRLNIWESDGTAAGSISIYDELRSIYFMTSNLTGYNNQLVFLGPGQTEGTSLLTLDIPGYALNEVKQIEDSTNPPFIFQKGTHDCHIDHSPDGLFFISAFKNNAESVGWISGLTGPSTEIIPSLHGVRNMYYEHGHFYMALITDEHGSELGISDGTEANTVLLVNINPFYVGLSNTKMATINNTLLFNANDYVVGDELWSYDGDNLALVKDIRPGSSGSSPREFASYHNMLYFSAYNGTDGNELWRTDGTATGTQMVIDLASGSASSNPYFMKVFKDDLIFVASLIDHSIFWKTDGQDVTQIKDLGLNKFGNPYAPSELAVGDELFYFKTNVSGDQVWVSDGTNTGTFPLKTFSECDQLTVVGNRLFFTAVEEGSTDKELWTTDGTIAGTHLVEDIGEGYSSEPRDLFSFNGDLVFTAYVLGYGRELWKATGDGQFTSQQMDFYPGSGSTILDANFCELHDQLYFSGGYTLGKELYKNEPIPTLIKDVRPGPDNSFPSLLTHVQDQIYFQAYDDEHGTELWVTNGNPGGTKLASETIPGTSGSTPTDMIAVGNMIYFQAESVLNGRQIWKLPYEIVIGTSSAEPVNPISIYPVPAKNEIYIKSDGPLGDVKIYNLVGQLVLHNSQNHNHIEITSLPPGLYFAVVQFDSKTFSKQFVKE